LSIESTTVESNHA